MHEKWVLQWVLQWAFTSMQLVCLESKLWTLVLKAVDCHRFLSLFDFTSRSPYAFAESASAAEFVVRALIRRTGGMLLKFPFLLWDHFERRIESQRHTLHQTETSNRFRWPVSIKTLFYCWRGTLRQIRAIPKVHVSGIKQILRQITQ